MSHVYITLPLFALFSFRLVYGYPGDTVMVPPQFEARNMDPYAEYPSAYQQRYTSQFQVNRNNPQQVLHTNIIHKRQQQVPMTEKQNDRNITFGEFLGALNELSQHREEELQRARTAGTAGRDDNPAYSPLPRPIGYSRPNYAPSSTTYNETPSSLTPLTPPSTAQPKVPVLKPDFTSLLTPVTTKVASKSSGLLGLIFSLLSSSSSGGLQMTGLKELLIDGIIKPLLEAKGGLKLLISKMTIPVISLLLINLEVLITVWWLWEDCPKAEPTPTYPKPSYPTSNSNYNAYS